MTWITSTQSTGWSLFVGQTTLTYGICTLPNGIGLGLSVDARQSTCFALVFRWLQPFLLMAMSRVSRTDKYPDNEGDLHMQPVRPASSVDVRWPARQAAVFFLRPLLRPVCHGAYPAGAESVGGGTLMVLGDPFIPLSPSLSCQDMNDLDSQNPDAEDVSCFPCTYYPGYGDWN